MIKVIRKVNIEELIAPTPDVISSNIIDVQEIDGSFIFAESIKPSIEIKYDRDGYPTIEQNTPDGASELFVDIGVQFDHRVKFLNFNLEDLLWKGQKKEEQNKLTTQEFLEQHNRYTFKLAISNENSKETTMWEFDGFTFEIPRIITKNPGVYNFTLIIEEYQRDDNENKDAGNIKISSPYFIERFVSKPFKGRILPSSYRPEYDLTIFKLETDQLSALTKSNIPCSLNDEGLLIINNTTDGTAVGEKLDNFVTYFYFDWEKITSHLKDFTLIMTFKHKEQLCGSLIERIDTSKDSKDTDLSTAIAWIPSEVYQTPGEWIVSIIGFAGNLDHINDPYEYNGDYYFYVSKEAKIYVSDNNLTQADMSRDTILSVSLRLLTSDNKAIITADDSIYTMKNNAGEDLDND